MRTNMSVCYAEINSSRFRPGSDMSLTNQLKGWIAGGNPNYSDAFSAISIRVTPGLFPS